MREFEGKTVLVTGSGSGIGRASALAFAAEGATVAVADINKEAGLGTVDLIAEAGGAAHYFHVDVSEEESVRDLIRTVAGDLGPIASAHNNAGVDGRVEPLLSTTFQEWRRIMSIDLDSVFLCLKYEIEHMLAHGGGTIVNTASASGLLGGYNHAAYGAAKHGVVGLTKAAAMEYIEQGVRINAICPGLIDTPFMSDLPQQLVRQLLAGTPANRAGRPAEIAQAVVWLASEKSSYVVGQPMPVDGGTTLGGSSSKF